MAILPKMMYGNVRVAKIVRNIDAKEIFNIIDSDNNYIYHKHQGTINSNTGCYTKPVYCLGAINGNTHSVSCGNTSWTDHGDRGDGVHVFTCGNGHVLNATIHPLGCPYTIGSTTTYNCSVCGTAYGGGGTCYRLNGYGLNCGFNAT